MREVRWILDKQAVQAYHAGIMSKVIQYTIRSVPERTDQLLREAAVAYGTSINQMALDLIAKGVGANAEEPIHHDLDDLIGTWVQDPECDKALSEMDRVDGELWQ
jgi:hypothetical protein